jgi:adenosylcobinamide-GDP ribazoletransferase
MFTVIPVAGGEKAELDAGDAVRAVLWLPAVGLLAGGLGGAVVLGVSEINASAAGRLLGAVLAVAATAAVTGALHLDGLADTADGLGSRRPAAAALEIMRRPDIGPMGVAALVFGLFIQVTAIAAVPRVPFAAAAVVLAEVTGRVAVVLATASPAARPGGFGALVAGQTTRVARLTIVALLVVAVIGAGVAADSASPAISGHGLFASAAGLVAAASGLTAGRGLQHVADRRLGGMTGDVFGAVLLVSATVTVVVAALLAGSVMGRPG